MLRVLNASEVLRQRRRAVDDATLIEAGKIVSDVRQRGMVALRAHAERLGDIAPSVSGTNPKPLLLGRADMEAALKAIDAGTREVLHAAAADIRAFAQAQRRCLADLHMLVPGGAAGHWVRPVASAGCYAPGGRFPLPSSVLMTAVTARAAGVKTVVVASPKPAPATLAAAAIADADLFLPCGGAHAIAALAYGCHGEDRGGEWQAIPACDALVGPGNRWVTAAKQLVAGDVAIDMLAGPSELLVIADGSARASVIAADLLAQAEHDDDAVPMLVVIDGGGGAALIARVNTELSRQLESLPTRETAERALNNGFAVLAATRGEAIALSDRLGPEHLQVQTHDADALARELSSYGAIFVGEHAAEVVGDYGVGPNHVLPTGGTARAHAGLSVLHFLKARTWLRMTPGEAASAIYRRTAAFARVEGLEAHARAADARNVPTP
ncbi:MAG: histidinol dehydrogenase [Planctomycetota bacterium]|nr:histidinol dehydrogenase [Planctomycetota bacterium]